jgi:ferredoxin-NADP reductase
MTSLSLLLWIVLAIALQLAIYLVVIFWRHWQRYLILSNQFEELDIAVLPSALNEVEVAPSVAWQGLRTFKVVKKQIEDEAQSVCSFYLVAADGGELPSYLPGQYLTFKLEVPSDSAKREPLVRCYSLSDAPSSDHYRISIKRMRAPVDSGLPAGCSSTYFHDEVQVGSLLEARAPSGHFHFDHSDAPVVLIAGGIGITPLLSMLNESVAHQPLREIWLFYSVRNRCELMMRAHLEALTKTHSNFHLYFFLSDADIASDKSTPFFHHGMITVALLRNLLPLKPFHYYICGPAAMMKSLVPALFEWGVPDAHIHFETFGPASFKTNPIAQSALPSASGKVSASAFKVSFANSGKEFLWEPLAGSLLEFSEAHGIAVNFGCRNGACGSCQTTIKSGEVAYQQPPDFDPEPGNCLLCVGTPISNLILEL